MTWISFLVIWFLSFTVRNVEAFTPKVEKGHKVSVWAKVPHPLQMKYSPTTKTLYIASHDNGGTLFRVHQGQVVPLLTGLNLPSSLELYKGDLYIAQKQEISVVKKIDQYLTSKQQPKVETLKGGLPQDYQNSLKRILIHQDFLYLSLGSPCNVCLPQDQAGTIQKMKLDGTNATILARGIRVAGLLALNPQDSSIWFSDLNREKLGMNMPAAELNILKTDAHYGFPFLHGKDVKDNFFFAQKPQELKIQLPHRELPAHSQPTAIFFGPKKNCMILVLNGFKHEGVWSEPKVVESCQNTGALRDRTLLSGFLEINTLKGRPFDLIALSPREFLVSDEFLGVIWKLEL